MMASKRRLAPVMGYVLSGCVKINIAGNMCNFRAHHHIAFDGIEPHERFMRREECMGERISRTHEWRRLDGFQPDDYIYIPERDREFTVDRVCPVGEQVYELAYFDLYDPADEGRVNGTAGTLCIARIRGVGSIIGDAETRRALLEAALQAKQEAANGETTKIASPLKGERNMAFDGIVLYFGDEAPSERVLQATCAVTNIRSPKVVGIVDLERDYLSGLSEGVVRAVGKTVLLLYPGQSVNPALVAKVTHSATMMSEFHLVTVLAGEDGVEPGKAVRLLSRLGNDV
jgi:hypothetical protein